MALRRPRRIFRGSAKAAPVFRVQGLRPAMVIGIACAVVAAGIGLLGASADLFGRVPAVTGTLTAPARAVAVVDGETLRLHETVVHLQGISAPARGSACDQGDCGTLAADALAGLVRGHAITCQLDGRDGEGFAQGVCEAGGENVNRGLVAAGWARAAGGSAALTAAEHAARTAKIGLWSAAPRL